MSQQVKALSTKLQWSSMPSVLVKERIDSYWLSSDIHTYAKKCVYTMAERINKYNQRNATLIIIIMNFECPLFNGLIVHIFI